MRFLKIIIPIIQLVAVPAMNAQPLIGFWKVNQVMVGSRDLTPVAKWFKYHEDHTYQAGNGWTHNDTGTWTYDPATTEFLPTNRYGEADEYGPFKSRFTEDGMTWER